MADDNANSWGPATREVRGGLQRSAHGEMSEALFLTAAYAYPDAASASRRVSGEEDGYIYGRFGNPTTKMFEDRLALIEDGGPHIGARATASGLAAVSASLLCFLNAGDHVAAGRMLFGGCRYIVETLLPRFGIGVTLFDARNPKAAQAAMQPNTKAVFVETPANPALELSDIAALSAIAHAQGALLIVDNVMASPVLQKPFAFGADLVVYSATKHIDGQGRCLGGAILGPEEFLTKTLDPYLRNTGPVLSPFNAWVLLKGLETLSLRVNAQSAAAAKIAAFVKSHKAVARIYYPFDVSHPQHDLALRQMRGGGSVVAFDLSGGESAAVATLNRLRLIDIANNLGDAKSILTHPATTTHGRMSAEARADLGIGGGLLRFSAGLEDVDDLIADLDAALPR